MIPWMLAMTAWAEPEIRSETLVIARTDALGQPFLGGIEVLGGTTSIGSAQLEGYGELGYRAGFDRPAAGEIYTLSVAGTTGRLQWTLGRQALYLPTWNRRLDGATARLDLRHGWSMDAALGVASHAGLRGTVGGVPVVRLAATRAAGPLTATAGAWVEVADLPVVHADLVGSWTPEAKELQPRVSGSAAVGYRANKLVLERGRAELSLRVASGIRAHAWVEHRESLPGTKLAADILATLAPSGSDTVGVATGVTNRRRDRLWASGSIQRASGVGFVGEVRWEPRCGAQHWCVRPGWQGLTGPGGILHRAGTSVVLPLPESVEVTVNGAWVPWRKPHLQWRSSYVAGLSATVRPSSGFAFEAGGDVFTGAHPSSIRGWLSLQVGARP